MEDAQRVYGYYSSSSGFNKEELAKFVKELYERVLEKVEQDELEEKIELSKIEAIKENIKKVDFEKV